ncbi:hypothetical protein ISCGN_010768 [Ixodes scapularis]
MTPPQLSSEVLLAHFMCLVGLGEACSYIGAILFYLEAVIKRREELTCTYNANAWLLTPQLQTLERQLVFKIDFASSRTKTHLLGRGTEPPQRDKEATVVSPASPGIVCIAWWIQVVPCGKPPRGTKPCAPFLGGALR